MFLKLFLGTLLLFVSLNAKECSPYYNPERFYDANDSLIELIEDNINQKGLELFGNSEKYKTLSFKKENDSYVSHDKHTRLNDYIYPASNGLWKYKIIKDKVDEISIARVELYRYSDAEIANDLNDTFENYWSDWLEDGYEMQLTPEQTLFRYNDKYFSFSVYIYGFKGDATPLKGTIVNYWFKDYTKHVNEHIQCMKEKNDS